MDGCIERLKKFRPGDKLVLLAFVLILAWALLENLSDGDSESKQLWLTLTIAALALVVRYILLLVPKEILGPVPGQVSLAIVSGSIASFLILWVGKQEPQPLIIENSSYAITWTFSDHDTSDSHVKMTLQLVHERVNRSNEDHLGWKKTWFEPYPGETGIEKASVRVAKKEAYLNDNRSVELPVGDDGGFVISLDQNDQEAQHAFVAPGETKWFKIEATMTVPISYWDIAVGQVALGKEPQFSMIDQTSSGLALILVDSSNEYEVNFNEKGETKNTIKLPSPQMPERPTRAQAYWFPEKLLTNETLEVIQKRFESDC